MNGPACNYGYVGADGINMHYVRHRGESDPISKAERAALLGGYFSDLDFAPFVGAGRFAHYDRLEVATIA
jgi:hypothetical protein